MQKGDDAFRSIGEVARQIGVAAHVLRYWETQFPQLKPMKRPDGRRYYRPDDIRLAAGLFEVLRDDGMTIRGARKLIAADKGETIRARGERRLAKADEQSVSQPVLAAEAAPDAAPDPAADVPARISAHSPAPPSGPAPDPEAQTGQPGLPLSFAPQPPAPARILPGDWLACLMVLRRSLGRLRAHDPHWSEAIGAARRLGQRITGHS